MADSITKSGIEHGNPRLVQGNGISTVLLIERCEASAVRSLMGAKLSRIFTVVLVK